MSFPARKKAQYLQLTTEQFDLLVIGGGITGAGIVLDAVTRGLLESLFGEKSDFASGTSSPFYQTLFTVVCVI